MLLVYITYRLLSSTFSNYYYYFLIYFLYTYVHYLLLVYICSLVIIIDIVSQYHYCLLPFLPFPSLLLIAFIFTILSLTLILPSLFTLCSLFILPILPSYHLPPYRGSFILSLVSIWLSFFFFGGSLTTNRPPIICITQTSPMAAVNSLLLIATPCFYCLNSV